MDFKKVMLLVGALVVAAVTAFMAKNMFTGAGAQQAEAAAPGVPLGPKVLVARKDLPVGTIIDQTMLGFQDWPKDALDGAYYAQGTPDADPSKLLGTVVRFPVTAGQPLTRGSLVGPKDRGFLAAALGPGMRAVTVPVTTSNGVAGFVFPGDRVDMVLNQTVDNNGGDGAPLKVSETIVRNVRVLATDQRISSKDEDGKTEVKTFSNVTLEVTPRIAEKVSVAQSVGTLSLSLRSLADSTSELERAVASGEVKVPAGTTPADERRLLNAYASRPMDNNTTFTTGGDVSRFQRRTVPAKVKSRDELAAEVARNAMDKYIDRVAPGAGGGSVASGPVVRVTRGSNVTIVPVGGR
ncbi:Flp pilus assembly protein CpaB [Sphingomonas sinipercae]|uniref:Flp pilus assembly protein CpaB n=1 Tax=Sphingomonas sinipercae TaxID=2714944 RepID=A0A6G7ZPC9_9SPHN|nr:Flp pilus assembly protein CpaB [Sphingomonas sinipercae]QIL02788.1 Flp pilus assembly protein CpaB [Sphingomonas sinipercae]